MSRRKATSKASRNEAAIDADQAEAEAIRYSGGAWVPLGRGLRDDEIAETLEPDLLPGGAPPPAYDHSRRDAELDTRVSNIGAEIARRIGLLGEKYPFELNEDKTSIRHLPSRTYVYEFCLAISLAQDLSSAPFNQLPRSFERLTAHVAQAFLGDGAEALRTAWPPDGDRPTTFKETIELLRSKTREWWWRPIDELANEPQAVKDGGVDVVVWKYPDPQRVGGLMLLGQCACGNDWTGKLSDLNIEKLEFFVNPISVARQVRFLSIPFHIPDERQWIESSSAAHLIFDRARIVLIAEEEKNYSRVIDLAKKPYKELTGMILVPYDAPVVEPLPQGVVREEAAKSLA